MNWLRPYVGVGLLVVALTMGPLLIIGAMGWPGGYEACLQNEDANCYCEKVDRAAIDRAVASGVTITDELIERSFILGDGFIKQPFSTWSNLVPALIGLIILFFIGRGYYPLTYSGMQNPMVVPTVCSILFGCAVVFQGTGSMYLHASLREWGGYLDNVSMNFFISLILLYNIARITRMRNTLLFGLLFLGINIVLGVLVFPGVLPGAAVFGALVGGAILLELIILYPGVFGKIPLIGLIAPHVRHIRRQNTFGWLWAGLLMFGGAFVIWILSGDSGPWCEPGDAIHGHGFWHILSGLASGAFYLHFRTERTV